MSRSNPMLNCLECQKDLGDLAERVRGLDQLSLCPECFDQTLGRLALANLDRACDGSSDCGEVTCQQCCTHDERDHGVCMDCGHEQDPGEAIDRAMDYLESER